MRNFKKLAGIGLLVTGLVTVAGLAYLAYKKYKEVDDYDCDYDEDEDDYEEDDTVDWDEFEEELDSELSDSEIEIDEDFSEGITEESMSDSEEDEESTEEEFESDIDTFALINGSSREEVIEFLCSESDTFEEDTLKGLSDGQLTQVYADWICQKGK